MLTVYNCIISEHDLRLVALAALVCALASLTAINLLHHVGRADRRVWGTWLGIAATAIGFGIWATHFIAMLAFSPALPTAYNVELTVVSLLAAVVLTGIGFGVAILPASGAMPWLGGAIVGGGIAVMHYTGMAAFEVSGTLTWDWPLVAASILLGGLLGGLALWAGLRSQSLSARLVGALLLTLAICSHHFTAMGAVAITPDNTIEISASAIPSEWLAAGVAFVSLAILLLAVVALTVDLRERRRTSLEMQRMRDLTDAAIEGLVLCDGETIVSVNQSFTRLTGLRPEHVCGQSLTAWVPDVAKRDMLLENLGQAVETELRHSDGTAIPVELIARRISYNDSAHNVVAFRDLRDRRNAEAQIRYLAHHDPLTGLDNRASFDERLDREIGLHRRTGRKLALLCLDLDGFKDVNDLYGHATGDQLLRDIARHFSSVLDEGQMLARLGGDEFAVIAPQISDPAEVGRLAESLLKSLKGADRESSRPASSRSASALRCIHPMRRTARSFFRAPTRLFTVQRSKEREPIASLRRPWARRSGSVAASSTICAMPLPTGK